MVPARGHVWNCASPRLALREPTPEQAADQRISLCSTSLRTQQRQRAERRRRPARVEPAAMLSAHCSNLHAMRDTRRSTPRSAHSASPRTLRKCKPRGGSSLGVDAKPASTSAGPRGTKCTVWVGLENDLFQDRVQFHSGVIDFMLCAGRAARKVLTGGSPKKNRHAIG